MTAPRRGDATPAGGQPAALAERAAAERQYMEAGGRQVLVNSVSGGVDSTAAALISREASPQSLALVLPIDPGESGRHDVADANRVAAHLGMPAATVDLTDAWRIIIEKCGEAAIALAQELGIDVPPARLEWARNNLKPALRIAAAGFLADALGGLTIGTSNAIEYFLGYFSIRGDAVADRQPLRDLTKGEVRALAREGGFPADLVERTPSAGLWPGQTDENELGFGYDDADRFFLWLLERHREQPVLDATITVLPDAVDTLLARPDLPIPADIARLIIARNRQTAFKRRSGDLERLLAARGLLTASSACATVVDK